MLGVESEFNKIHEHSKNKEHFDDEEKAQHYIFPFGPAPF